MTAPTFRITLVTSTEMEGEVGLHRGYGAASVELICDDMTLAVRHIDTSSFRLEFDAIESFPAELHLTFRRAGMEPVSTLLYLVGEPGSCPQLDAFWNCAGRQSDESHASCFSRIVPELEKRADVLLRGAAICLSNDRLEEALTLLRMLAAQQPDLSSLRQFDDRWGAQLLRGLRCHDDRANVATRVSTWLALCSLWPDNMDYLSGALTFGHSLPFALPSIVALARQGVEHPSSNRQVRLAAACLLLRSSDEASATKLRASLPGPSGLDPPFGAHFKELDAVLLLRAARAKTADAADVARAEAALLAFYRQAAADNDLAAAVGEIAVWNRYRIDGIERLSHAALAQLWPELDLGSATAALSYFNAIGSQAEARAVVDAWLTRPGASEAPAFCRAACAVAIKQRDRELENELLQSFSPAATAHSDLEVARIGELTSRRASLPVQSPFGRSAKRPRVFVGLFGQLRHYQHVLPALVDYVRKDLAAERQGQKTPEVVFALASWQHTGERVTRPEESTDLFFYPLLPPELVNVLRSTAYTIDQAKQVFPNIVSFAVARQHSTSEVALAEALQGILGGNSHVMLDDETIVEAEALSLDIDSYQSCYPEGQRRELINQLKMWSRVRRLAQMAADIERDGGQPFDACILIRPDLRILRGTFRPLLEACMQPGNADMVFSDNGLENEYFEGAGESYYVSSRQGLTMLGRCHERLQHALRPSMSPPYHRARRSAHAVVSSLIFSSGFSQQPHKKPLYVIDRQTFPLRDFVPAIARDAEFSANELVRRGLSDLLSRLN